MLAASVIALALSAAGVAQAVVPAGYNKVYLTSMVDVSFVVQAKSVTTGSTVVVYVLSTLYVVYDMSMCSACLY